MAVKRDIFHSPVKKCYPRLFFRRDTIVALAIGRCADMPHVVGIGRSMPPEGGYA
jgi:hypothetical protein